MCIIGNVGEALIGVSAMAPVVPASSAPSSTSSRLVQIMKPKLSRKITRTPKINLNKYWNLFENIMENGGCSAANESRGNANEFDDTEMNNEINENISNEQREMMNDISVRRNNERNARGSRYCTCHFCLISDLRNVTVTERSEEVTEL